jgi:hypothetical protein
MGEVEANPPVSDKWLYTGWQNRKEHNITRNQIDDARFYDISDSWTTISGNPADRHAFQPVHNTTIVEVNKIVDGAPRKYFAYDSDASGSQIRLYYTDNFDATWTPYSQNPILNWSGNHFRWPSVAYVNGTFHMFLSDLSDATLERWTSTDGISFVFQENVKTGGNQCNNPFIWHNPNDAKWYLYTHDASEGKEYINVRNASNIEDLDLTNDTTVLSQTTSFGSPTVMYHENKYWLLAEILQGEAWKVVAYYSTTSPSSGFSECSDSPILSDDEACPMLLLTPNQAKAYLFTNRDSSKWYQDTQEVYFNKTTSETPNLVDYQVRITAYYENGTDNGDKVYLNRHSRTDFGDIRFTWFNSSSRDEVECDYWIEELKTNDNAVFWVKIPEISSTINNTIYIYYGKSDATTTSNGEATFDFFDDFNGTLAKWTQVGGTWQIENGELSAQTTTYGQRIRAKNFIFGNNSVHVKVKWIAGTYFEHGPYVRGQLSNEQYFGYMTFLSTCIYFQRQRISKITGGPYGTTIIGNGTIDPSRNVWYNIEFKLYGNRLKSSISPLYYTEISGTDSSFNNGTLCLFSWSASSEHSHFDDLFVCKYVEPEPSHADWGSEEISTYVIVDQTFVSDKRADVNSVQTIGFHAKWSNNGSDVVGGSIYVNDTNYVTNSTGWINIRAAARIEAPDNFTIIALPDTQFYSASHPEIFDSQTQWVVSNAQSMNIVFVTHEGDIVDDYSSLSQWNNANNSMSKLDAGNVSYGVLPGNHDGSPLYLSNFNKFFNYSRFNGKSWYGGAYQNENTNNFELFQGGLDDYLIFHFQYDPSDQVLKWANSTLQNYPNRQVIVTTHSYLNVDESRTDIGNRIWQNFVAPHADQIFLVLCGHNHGETQRTDIINDHTVYQIMADYQDRTNGGNGWLRTLEFHPVEDKIYVRTYSPYLNNYETDANSQFTLDYNMTWVAPSIVEKVTWIVTGVNCSGVTAYSQIVQNPSIIWDRIKISDGGISKGSVMLGETVTIWFKAIYEYDNTVFTNANGILYLNGSAMTWSTTNTRWGYTYTATAMGTATFTISGVYDESYGLTIINDTVGSQTINVLSTPFSVISNSTISELAFNSTSKTLTFTVSGQKGTMGYTNVTIAKTLIEDISELKVYVDGNQINSTAVSTDYYWLIHFTYQHSTHRITIVINPMVEHTPTSFLPTHLLLLLVIVTLILVTSFYKRSLIKEKIRRIGIFNFRRESYSLRP